MLEFDSQRVCVGISWFVIFTIKHRLCSELKYNRHLCVGKLASYKNRADNKSLLLWISVSDIAISEEIKFETHSKTLTGVSSKPQYTECLQMISTTLVDNAVARSL